MLRLTRSLVRQALQHPAQPMVKSLQFVSVGNRRWLAKRLQSGPGGSATLRMEEGKKVTPIGWLLLLVPATTFGLGCWQVKRKAWKEELIKNIENLRKTAAVPLPENLAEVSSMEYHLVTVRGKFLHDKEIYMGPRSLIRPDGSETAGGLFSQQDTGNGYYVITPFKLADRDDIVLINRGWVSRKHQDPQTRQAGQFEQDLELTCVVRGGEKPPQFAPAHRGNMYLYRDLPKMSAQTGAAPVFLDATYKSSVPGGPVGGQTRITLHNDHMSYYITWFGLSIATSLLWYRQIIRRLPF